MKTKLYKKFIKRVCKLLKISKKQLFNRDFTPRVLKCYTFNRETKKLDFDPFHLIVLEHKRPLSQLWVACDGHCAWLFKHWKHSHWREYIQTRIDLGEEEDHVVADVCRQNKVAES